MNLDALPVLISGGIWAVVVIKALRSRVSVATLALVLMVAALVFAQFASLLHVPFGGSIAVGAAGALLLLFWDRTTPYP